jgi:hypothetical protein
MNPGISLRATGTIIAVLSAALLCGPGINAGNGCRLTVSVVDGFGSPLSQDEVSITVVDSFGSAVSYRDHLLPYGHYVVKASCSMFKSFERAVDLRDSSVLVVAGLLMLDAGNLSGDSADAGYSITGKLLGGDPSDRPIVRLLTPYGDLVLDTRPAASGGFAFRGLPNGRYVIAGLSTRHPTVTSEVRVGNQYGNASVVLRLR